MQKLTKAMCWDLVSKTKDRVNGVGVAVYRKPTSNECYEQRSKDAPPICQGSDDPNAAWYYSQSDGNFNFSININYLVGYWIARLSICLSGTNAGNYFPSYLWEMFLY